MPEIAPGASQTPDLVPAHHPATRDEFKGNAAKREARAAFVAELRVRGLPFRKIAARLGIDAHTAQDDWRRFLADNKPSADDVETYREIQKARYEERLASARVVRDRLSRERTVNVAEFARLQAVENQSEEGLRRLLGTEAPQRVEVQATVGVEVDGSLRLTAQDWADLIQMKSLEDEVRKLLPPSCEIHESPVIDVTPIAPANGNGHGHE